MFNPLLILAIVLLAFALTVGLTAALRVARARRRARRRVVEQPNSHYTSPIVRATETRHRWQGMSLENIHEINRAEVVRLLARVEATSVDTLRPNERSFLDHMAGLAGHAPSSESREKGKGVAPDLRHRPA